MKKKKANDTRRASVLKIVIADSTSRFKSDNSKKEIYTALLGAKKQTFKGEKLYCQVWKNPKDWDKKISGQVIIFVHVSDLSKSFRGQVQKLAFSEAQGPKVIRYGGGGAFRESGDNCKRVFAITESIDDPIFNTCEPWKEIFEFLLDPAGLRRPKAFSYFMEPDEAAARILLTGMRYALKGEAALTTPEKNNEKLRTAAGDARERWKRASAESRAAYWDPLTKVDGILDRKVTLRALMRCSLKDKCDEDKVKAALKALSYE